MAHKTVINGTAYEILGGSVKVGGTGYSILKGKILVGGTGYDISFGGGAWSWGNDGDYVDSDWFTGLKDFCTSSSSSDVAGLATPGQTKMVQLQSSILGATEIGLTMIGANIEKSNSITFCTDVFPQQIVPNSRQYSYASGNLRTTAQSFATACPGSENFATITRSCAYYSGYSGSPTSGTYADTVSVPNVKNIFGGTDLPSTGTQFPYFTQQANRIATLNGTAVSWATSDCAKSGEGSYYVSYVYPTGIRNYQYYNTAVYVRLIFTVG